MSEPHTQPETWGQASGGWSNEFFQMRLYQTKSLPHLRAAKEYERNHKNRSDRIDRLDEQIAETLDLMDTHDLTEAIEDELNTNDVDRAWIGTLNEAKE